MDPTTTTLITFMLQTSPAIHSVHLIGSWDNFTKRYSMEPDIKRARGQWRGCFTFDNIILDSDGQTSIKHKGGLKMGSTYYFYYELNGCVEVHDSTLPSTSFCPNLPGQPVNFLTIPVEVRPARYRSASETSLAGNQIQTMNPADKFMTPRPPPRPPVLSRLNTSPAILAKNRTTRSASPRLQKSPWSFFGLRSPLPTSRHEADISSTTRLNTIVGAYNDLVDKFDLSGQSSTRPPQTRSQPQTRETSPHRLLKKSRSGENLQLQGPKLPEKDTYVQNSATLRGLSRTKLAFQGPAHVNETFDDGEDDANFASDMNGDSLASNGLTTSLSPPLSDFRLLSARNCALHDLTKPLPEIPYDSHQLWRPAPLRLCSPPAATQLLTSHFSVSTMSSGVTSPTESETFSSFDYKDGEDEDAGDFGSDDELSYSPLFERVDGFSGYTLPEEEHSSVQTLGKESLVPLSQTTSSRATFGGAAALDVESVANMGNLSVLEELFDEIGYLGDLIVGK